MNAIFVFSTETELYYVLVEQPSQGINNTAGQPNTWRLDSYWPTNLLAMRRVEFLKSKTEGW